MTIINPELSIINPELSIINPELSIDNIKEKIARISHFFKDSTGLKGKTLKTLVDEGEYAETVYLLIRLFNVISSEKLSFLGDLDLDQIYIDENTQFKISNFPSEEKIINTFFTEVSEWVESTSDLEVVPQAEVKSQEASEALIDNQSSQDPDVPSQEKAQEEAQEEPMISQPHQEEPMISQPHQEELMISQPHQEELMISQGSDENEFVFEKLFDSSTNLDETLIDTIEPKIDVIEPKIDVIEPKIDAIEPNLLPITIEVTNNPPPTPIVKTSKQVVRHELDQEKYQSAISDDFEQLKKTIKSILDQELSKNEITAKYNMHAILSNELNEIENALDIESLNKYLSIFSIKYNEESNLIKNHQIWINSFFKPSFFESFNQHYTDFEEYQSALKQIHIDLPEEWLKTIFNDQFQWKINLETDQMKTIKKLYAALKKYLQIPPFAKAYKNPFKDFPVKDSWDPLDPQREVKPNHKLEYSNDDVWCMQTCGIRGNSHKHESKHYEDYADFQYVKDWKIIVVSDGMGSAKYSRLSSYILVNEVQKALKISLSYLDVYQLSDFDFNVPENENRSKQIVGLMKILLMDAVQAARYAVFNQYQQIKSKLNEDIKLKDFQATLLICIHHPCKNHDLTMSMQIGDGLISILTQNPNTREYEAKLLSTPDHGEFAGQTHGIFVENIDFMIREKSRFKVSKDPITAIAVMTDGVSDDFFPEKDRIRDLFLSENINEMFSASGHGQKGLYWSVVMDENPNEKLLEWLSYEKKQSHDDRSIVFAYRKDILPILSQN